MSFTGGDAGEWRVQTQRTLSGDPLPAVARLSVGTGASLSPGSVWTNTWTNLWQIRGVMLAGVSPATEGEPSFSHAAALAPTAAAGPNAMQAMLLAVRHHAAWWALAPQERAERAVAHWQHLGAGLKRLSANACRRYDCRDLGSHEPIDSLLWFAHPTAGSNAFEDLVGTLRASPAWAGVDREIELRLVRD